MTGGQDDDGTEVQDLTDEELALILAVEVPPDSGDVRDPERPYTTDRIHVLRDLPRVRRPEGFETH